MFVSHDRPLLRILTLPPRPPTDMPHTYRSPTRAAVGYAVYTDHQSHTSFAPFPVVRPLSPRPLTDKMRALACPALQSSPRGDDACILWARRQASRTT